MSDLRFAVRQLLKKPGFTAVAVLTLALGIGANTVVFSVARTVLFRPLGFETPDRLMWVRLLNTQSGSTEDRLSSRSVDRDWNQHGGRGSVLLVSDAAWRQRPDLARRENVSGRRPFETRCD